MTEEMERGEGSIRKKIKKITRKLPKLGKRVEREMNDEKRGLGPKRRVMACSSVNSITAEAVGYQTCQDQRVA